MKTKSIFPSSLLIRLILLLLLSSACARMSSPAGGPRDVDPPVPLRSRPVNYSTNFDQQKIIIEFDEYVVLKNIRQELLVSPPLPEKPIVKQRGKALIIKINNQLNDSTTYNFNFYNAISDLNEGNALPDFQFEFSTGPKFDSIYLAGYMHDAFNFKPEENLYVMLYDKFNDSIPRTTKPNYIAKTDKEGRFYLTNLKNIPYYIFGLKDLNNDMMYDLPNERIAFIDSSFSPTFVEKTFVDTIKIIKSISDNLKDTVWGDSLTYHKSMVTTIGNIRLYMFTEDNEQQYFKDAYRPEKQQVIVSFNRELKDSFSIVPLAKDTILKNWYTMEPTSKNDSLVFWLTDSILFNKDSLSFQLNYTMKDSNQQNYIKTDTLLTTYKAPEKKPAKGKEKKKGAGRLNLNFLNNSDKETKEDSVIPPSELTFKTNFKTPFEIPAAGELIARFPVKNIDQTKIQFSKIEDDTVKIPVKYELTQSETEFRKYLFSFNKDEEELFEVFIPAGAITDIYGHINDTLDYKFKIRPLNYYCKISMTIKGVEENSVVQLLNEKENVLEERNIIGDTTLVYDYLAPSKYKFKLYYDSNGNGKWDTGKFSKLQQPEKVFYYPFFPEKLELKGNTETENTWNLYPNKGMKDVDPLKKAETTEE